MADKPRMEVADLRPEVLAFAFLMEQRLSENDDKPGWKGEWPHPLIFRVVDETAELGRAMQETAGETTTFAVGAEAADVANFSMMIADIYGALDLDHAREIIGEDADGYDPDIVIPGDDETGGDAA
jgi:NTP pyrophosphatase (non-canonical NTP hydrolase)